MHDDLIQENIVLLFDLGRSVKLKDLSSFRANLGLKAADLHKRKEIGRF